MERDRKANQMIDKKQIKGYQIEDFRLYDLWCFSKGENHFLLADNGCIIILNTELMKSIYQQNPSDALKFKLVQHGLAYISGKEMFCRKKEIDIRYFIIDLTKKCNFHCIYCFRDFQNETIITWEKLKDILEYILNYCRANGLRKIGLQVWGGEPLLAFDRIEYVVKFFSDTELQVTIDIETNGSLVTEEIARKLYHMGIQVGVSIDGTPQLQNMQRPFVTGKWSATSVESGIQNLQKYYGKKIGGITVITKYNYKYIKEMLDYYIYHLHLSSMKFNLVRDNHHAKEQNLALTKEETEWFFQELLSYLQAYHNLGVNFSEGNIEIRANNLLHRSNYSCCISHGCQGGKHIISFDRDGNIFPCEMMDFPEEKIGSIYDKEVLDIQIEKAIKENKFFKKKQEEKCNHCPWWYYCQGGCSSRNRYLEKDGFVDITECCINNVVYPQLIEWILDGYIN